MRLINKHTKYSFRKIRFFLNFKLKIKMVAVNGRKSVNFIGWNLLSRFVKLNPLGAASSIIKSTHRLKLYRGDYKSSLPLLIFQNMNERKKPNTCNVNI